MVTLTDTAIKDLADSGLQQYINDRVMPKLDFKGLDVNSPAFVIDREAAKIAENHVILHDLFLKHESEERKQEYEAMVKVLDWFYSGKDSLEMLTVSHIAKIYIRDCIMHSLGITYLGDGKFKREAK